MKRKFSKILGVGLALVLVLTLSLVTAVPAAAVEVVPDRETAITLTADRLVALQSSTDYGWDWIITDLLAHSGSDSAYNMYGVVILGLLDAYEETSTASYLDAATNMANHMTNNLAGAANLGEFHKNGVEGEEYAGAYDYQFLMRYAEIPGNSAYGEYAIALWEWNKEHTAMFASPEALNNELGGWAGPDPGAASWMLAAYGTAIHAMGDDLFATGCAAIIVDNLGSLVGDHMALAECLEFLSELEDPLAYGSTIDGIITALIEAQQADGHWDIGFSGSILQDNSYPVRALAAYGGTDGLDAARKGAAWLIANQLPNGGWLDDGVEHSEMDAEVLRALVATAAPVTIGDLGYYSIQSAINSASEGNTINVAAGEYAGAVVDKDVTVSGVEGGASVITSGVPYKVDNPAYITAFRPGADGAEIRNFTIDCGEVLDLGVYAIGVDGVTVDSLTINSDGTVTGITNWGGSNWVITNNVITNTEISGGGGIGINVSAKAQQQCTGNLVQYNEINATATAETYSCPGILVCLDTRSTYNEVDVDGTEDVSGNQILDNIIMSSGVNNAVGIEVGTILGNSEADLDRTDPVLIAALMAAGAVRDNVVQDNSIDGADTGIYFYNVTGLTVTQNEIVNSIENGIYVEHGHSGVTVNYNNIYGNAYGLEHEDIEGVDYGPIDATLNWWGDASGPYHPVGNPNGSGNAVSNNVVFDPWLYSFYTADPGAAALTMTATFESKIGISVSPTSISFGSIIPDVASHQMVTVRNTGTIPENFTASLTNISTPDVYTTGLAIDDSSVNTWNPTSVPPTTHRFTDLTLTVPAETEAGTYTAVLVFWAVAAE